MSSGRTIPAAWLAQGAVVVYTLRAEDSTCDFVSENVEALTGWSAAEALRPGWWSACLHADDRGEVLARQAELAIGRPLRLDYRFRTRDGDYVWIRDHLVRMQDGDGSARVVGSWTEITELKTATAELAESVARYRELFELNPMPMWIYALDTLRFLSVNEAAVRTYGYSEDEFLGLTLRDIRPREDLPRLEAHLQLPLEPLSNSTDWRHLRKDGAVIDVEITSHAIDHQGVPARLVVVRDVTQSKRAEAERARLAAAIEHTGEAIVITDRDGAIQYVNPAFEQVSGFSREETIGRNPRLLNSGKQSRAFYREMWETISTGASWRGRMVNRRKDGSLFTEDAVISPVLGNDGEIVSFVAVKRDVTAELELESQLRQAQKLEAIGGLAGGVAHDFNNMLSVILGNAELALADLPPADPLRDRLEEIRRASERSAALTRQLLGFARRQTMTPRAVDLNEAIETLLKMLRRLIGENIDLEWRPAQGLWPVWIDPSQLDQILANLCVNARDAIAGAGRISIRTENLVSERAGDSVRLRVADTGAGMDAETLERIFEPFFTTKGVGHGTGLGLATVYGIVQQNHGRIDVESTPGTGTCFTIDLPRHGAATAAEAAAVPEPRPVGSGECVLVVEDDPGLLRALTLMVERCGYVALSADGPESALALASSHPGEIRLLLTDVVMPGINGYQLAERFAKLRPAARCLFMSGYAAGSPTSNVVAEAPRQFIQKPFSGRDLAARLRDLLEAD